MYKKFKAQRVSFQGRSFASKLEAAVYMKLQLLEKDSLIEIIQCQAQIEFEPFGIIYKPDFKIIDLKTNTISYVEAKGYETPEWKLKLKIYRKIGPCDLWIYQGSWQNPKLNEIVVPEGYSFTKT